MRPRRVRGAWLPIRCRVFPDTVQIAIEQRRRFALGWSKIAAQRSVNASVQPANDSFDAVATDVFSSRPVAGPARSRPGGMPVPAGCEVTRAHRRADVSRTGVTLRSRGHLRHEIM